MSKATKTWLIIAAALVLVGCMAFAGVMSALAWDFTKLSTAEYEVNTHEIDQEFNSITIKADTADIVFALSEDGKCRVECYEEKRAGHSVTVQVDTLVVELVDERSAWDYIGIHAVISKITVYLPGTEYTSLFIDGSTGDIKMPQGFEFKDVDISSSTGDVDFGASASGAIRIKSSTGDIRAENLSAGLLDLAVSTGKVTVSAAVCAGDVTVDVSTGRAYLTDVSCKNVISSGNTGDISLKAVVATEAFSIRRSAGDVKLEDCDAAEIVVKTSTGDVEGTLLSEKVFVINTNTGNKDVPQTTTGGRCEITTDTGDIRISVRK